MLLNPSLKLSFMGSLCVMMQFLIFKYLFVNLTDCDWPDNPQCQHSCCLSGVSLHGLVKSCERKKESLFVRFRSRRCFNDIFRVSNTEGGGGGFSTQY